MGDSETETKKLLAKLEELEREEGEIEVLEQESRESSYQDREEGEINGEEGAIHGEVDISNWDERQRGNSLYASGGAVRLYEKDAGSGEENVYIGILDVDTLNSKRENEAEEASATGAVQVQAFECFTGDENGASSDMEIEEDIPSPNLSGTRVSAYFGETGTASPLVVSEVGSQIQKGGIANNSGDSMLKRKRIPDLSSSPVIQVSYEGLSRESKKKLQEALHQWSHWHSRHYHSDSGACKETLESGSDVYSPALYLEAVGNSSVSVWMDRPSKQVRKTGSEDVYGSASREKAEEEVPLYDRAYVSALCSQDLTNRSDRDLAIESEGSSRCFNCGAYSHSLSSCPRPRDTNAIKTARKIHVEKKGYQTRGRAPLRYYQSSPGGKYDNIKPGELGNETRQSLGIGEHDPPPWLHRMRELGYPPGYLEEAEESSEVEIFGGIGDEAGADSGKEQAEDGEIVEKRKTDDEQTAKKMTVQFPGINAPIPGNADNRLWTSPADSQTMQAQRTVKRNSPQQLSTGGPGGTGLIQHTFSWSVSSNNPPSRDECTPESNFSLPIQWARHESSSGYGIPNSPMDSSDVWKKRDGETSTGMRSTGPETHQPLPSSTGLASEHPPRGMFRAPGVGDVLPAVPTPHVYSRQYHAHPSLLSLPVQNNRKEAWLKAMTALDTLPSDHKSGNSTSQQQWGRK